LLEPVTVAVNVCEFPADNETDAGLTLMETELPPIETLTVAVPPPIETLLIVVVGYPVAVAVRV
jgi:hypothetical protein